MNILSLEAIHKQFADRPLLDGVTMGIDAGERVGVVGVNGSGKTTLLRIVAGAEAPDSGRVSMTRDLRVAYLPQNSALDPDLQQVQGNGTKIVFVDTSSSNPALGITRITSNNAQGGALAADELAKQIGDKGTVSVISVKKGTSTTDARVQGFQQEMRAKQLPTVPSTVAEEKEINPFVRVHSAELQASVKQQFPTLIPDPVAVLEKTRFLKDNF